MDITKKLDDPQSTFTQQEMYEAFEVLAERFGFYRDERLPMKGAVQETTSMTVDGYEHLGVLIVRPRTIQDAMITIPSRVDAVLKDNFSPSQNTLYNATTVAMAKELIVSPPGIVETVLASTDPKDIGFFGAFAKEYQQWMEAKTKEAGKKKSGKEETEDGNASVSWSETGVISSQPIPDGSPLPRVMSSTNTDRSSP